MVKSELADVVAPLWTAEHTRRILELSSTVMSELRRNGSLLAVQTTDEECFYPVWQFERRDRRVQVKPALREFMMALRDRNPWTVAVLIRTPAPELGGLTPLDWVRQAGDVQTLCGYAEVLGAEYTR